MLNTSLINLSWNVLLYTLKFYYYTFIEENVSWFYHFHWIREKMKASMDENEPLRQIAKLCEVKHNRNALCIAALWKDISCAHVMEIFS